MACLKFLKFCFNFCFNFLTSIFVFDFVVNLNYLLKNKKPLNVPINKAYRGFVFGADDGNRTRDLILTKYVYKIKEFCTHLQNSLFLAIFTPYFFKRSYPLSKIVRPFTAVRSKITTF